MELTFTFFIIEFALGLHIILALYFIILKKNKLLHSFDYPSFVTHFFQKFLIFNSKYLKCCLHCVDDHVVC
ncbi:hypothetical protein FLAPXU55_01227 [Flavobacterium panici]|uniref:Uncharacterized protein n=1 Tax=Flavobacterium panici TaxID=2654843 RepID=A0A9N8J168_9FLAO|nr:hypothetical protein FLAPXU55_01227 [Flavobacterium panici]